MSTTAKRSVTVNFAGQFDGDNTFDAADNEQSVAQTQFITLVSGLNTITVPGSLTTPATIATAVTIIPPAGNTQSITLKGVTGDTGIRLHNTDPTTIALDSSVSTIALTAGADIAGVRLVWS